MIQSPVLDAIDVPLGKEPEYRWFRYSRLALPFLLFILGCAVVLIGLTFWQANMVLWRIDGGLPRTFTIPDRFDDSDTSPPHLNRDLRISAVSIAGAGIVLAFVTMYAKPSKRKPLYFIAAFLLIIASVLAFIAFAVDVGRSRSVFSCRDREQGNVAFLDRRDICEDWTQLMVALAVFDIGLGFFCVLTAIILVIGATQTFVSNTTRTLVLASMFMVVIWIVLVSVFTVLIQEAQDVFWADQAFGTTDFDNPRPGWPEKNTRLRIAAAASVILLVLANLIPFRSRVVAYAIALGFLFTTPILLFAFSIDVRSLQDARDLPCPTDWDCGIGQYVATIFFEIFLCVIILLYLLIEFVARIAADNTLVAPVAVPVVAEY